MDKQTKNIINRAWIGNELKFLNKADIRSALVICCALAVFFLPIGAVIVYGIHKNFNHPVIVAMLVTIVTMVFTSPVLYKISKIKEYFNERKLILNGEFNVTQGEVLYMEEKTGRHTEYFLHFSGFEAVSVGHTKYDFTSKNDKYYLVYLKGTNHIKLLYSEKIYQYNEK